MMALQRKVRTTGDSLSVVIPSQLADYHDIDEGTLLEFQPQEKGVLKMVTIAKTCKVKKKGTDEIVTIRARNGECVPPKGYEVVLK